MESPLKKRKVLSQESQGSMVTSTPQRQTGNYHEDSPAISRIGNETSSSSSSDGYILSHRRRFDFSEEFSKLQLSNNAVVSDHSTLLDVIEKNSSIAEESEVKDEEEILDYDDFFSKLGRFQKKGHVWNLFKPVGEDEGSLYNLILTEPRNAGENATWFVNYCHKASKRDAVYLIYKLCLDCAGYQRTDIKKYFTDPLPPMQGLLEAIMKKVDKEDCHAEVFITGKFLFEDVKSRMAKILKNGIYNFLQKFVLEAHGEKLLYDEVFIRLLKLLEGMCQASYRQLVYTGVIFVMKILTAVCMVKVNIPDSTLSSKQQHMMLDNYINTLYLKCVKACRLTDNECSSLKLACTIEMRMWVQYSAQVFIDHYNCVLVLGKLVLDEIKAVRLAALETFQKLVQDEHLVSYLQAGPIEYLVDHVSGRFCDVDTKVALKAIEVYTTMITHHFYIIQKRKKTFEVLVENIYNKDYRIGTAACKCVIEIFNQDDIDERTLLQHICKLAMNFHPTLKPILVESCIENTNVLQNWSLIVEIYASPHCKDVPIEMKETLSELFLESVHQVITGMSSKVRPYSRRVQEVDLTHHKLIAEEIYPCLKAILLMYRKQLHIARNILKIVTKIKPEYLSKDHVKSVEQVLQFFIKFFKFWNDTDTLTALLDFLVFVSEYIPLLSNLTRNNIEDLRNYVSEELYKSFKSRDNRTIVIAKKTSIVFSKFDLNENIEWSKLLLYWDIIESNLEYLENMMKCCHWSLIWKIRKLSSSHLSKSEQTKEVSRLTTMSKSFFSTCVELMGHQDQNTKFKAFERICETYIAFCQELENISKQIRTLEDLKPCVKDEASQKQIMDIFELSVGRCEDVTAKKYAMYIVDMAFLKILPMECISVIFKYYDKNYETYGKLIESVMSIIIEKGINWLPMLIVNAICICFEKLLAKHGVMEIRSREAKDILSLSRKFAEYKLIKNPKIASKVLFYATNYAVDTTSYEFLIFVRVFINEIQNSPDMRREILEHLKKKVPKAYTKIDPVLYFGQHLANVEAKQIDTSKKNTKKGRPTKAPKAPKLNIQATKVKKTAKAKENVMPKKASQTTDSEASGDITIHDTSSDDLDVSEPSNLNISH